VIDWQRILLNLRSRDLSLAWVSREMQRRGYGMDAQTLQKIANGEVQGQRVEFHRGLALLDVHKDFCGDEHCREVIGAP